MYKRIDSKSIPLTKALAEKFQAMKPSPTEREYDAARVKYLRAKADQGRLVAFNWSTAKLGNEIYRMNGQHSSRMLCEMDGQMPDNLIVHLDEFEVEIPEDMALLFREFDDRNSGRTAYDVSRAYQNTFVDLASIDPKIGKLGIEGIGWWRREIEGVPAGIGDDLYRMFNNDDYHPFLLFVGETLSIDKTRELNKPPVIAAIYATYLSNEPEARAFWSEVARGGHEWDENAITSKLDKWLRELFMDVDKRRGFKPGDYYQGCVHAWNAFREGRPLTTIKHDPSKGFFKVAA